MPGQSRDEPSVLAARLYDTYGAPLYRYALMLLADRAAAEDAVQQVFAALVRQAMPADVRDERHYLRRAVRNQCVSQWRARRGRGEVAGEPLLEALPAPHADTETRLAVERALRDLSPEQREVVHLHVFEGLTFQETADIVGDSINTVASRYRYALTHLREILGSAIGSRGDIDGRP